MRLTHLLPALILVFPTAGSLYARQTAAYEIQAVYNDTVIHTVASGETLYSIAKAYRTSLQEVYRLNPSSRQEIKVGDKLSILKGRLPVGYNSHLIRMHETLYSVSSTYKTSINELKAANTGLDEKAFHAGKTIRIPVFGEKTYKVQASETLYDVAGKNHMETEKLIELNPVLKKERLKDGMILVISVK